MEKGTVYFFTGLAGAGKTTIGGLFYQRLKEIRPEAVLIDGDKNRDQANARAPKDYSTEAPLKAAGERGEFGPCLVEGPISLDLATDKEAAEVKGYHSPVAGDADILLAPSIAAGNLLGKSLYGLAGGEMAGVVLGAKAPITVNSRGATAEEKYWSILICAAMSESLPL